MNKTTLTSFDLQIGRHLQIDPMIKLDPNAKYWRYGGDSYQIRRICGVDYYCGTIVDVDNTFVKMTNNGSTFAVSHQHISQFWIPYVLSDIKNDPLNIGDIIYFTTRSGVLVKGEISEFGHFNGREIAFQTVNLEWPIEYTGTKYKTRRVYGKYSVLKIS